MHISYLLKMCRRHSQGTDDYDQRVKFVLLEKGDCVLFKNLAMTGKQKLQD